MRKVILSIAIACAFVQQAAAEQFESGDWAVTKVDDVCTVVTVRSAKHTSGQLLFSFKNYGFDASFSYIYTPWPGETDAPWGIDDEVVLEIDNEESWLSDEMSPYQPLDGYGVSITAGFIRDLISDIGAAQHSIGLSMNSQSSGEVMLYGLFSVAGFSDSIEKAGEWCQFDPSALPES